MSLDNRNKPQKYRLQSGVVPAHGTCIVWCDNKDAVSQLHAPFKLENADGASVSIQAEDGSWADCVEYLEQGRSCKVSAEGYYRVLILQDTFFWFVC